MSLKQLVDYGTDSDAEDVEEGSRSPQVTVSAGRASEGNGVATLDTPSSSPSSPSMSPSTTRSSDEEDGEGDWPFKVKIKLAARLIPPQPPGKCSNSLQRKIEQLVEKRRLRRIDMNNSVQSRKDFRNPSIYEKLVSFLDLDELGTCFPDTIYNMSSLNDYETLSKLQREAYEKKKSSRTQVEFVKGTKRPAAANAPEGEVKKRKSKWDSAPVPAISQP